MAERDPLRTYQQAKERFDALQSAVAQMGGKLKSLGEHMSQTPVRIMISGDGFTARLPIATGAPLSTSREEWPSFDVFMDLLTRYYNAEEFLDRARTQLTPADRKLLGL